MRRYTDRILTHRGGSDCLLFNIASRANRNGGKRTFRRSLSGHYSGEPQAARLTAPSLHPAYAEGIVKVFPKLFTLTWATSKFRPAPYRQARLHQAQQQRRRGNRLVDPFPKHDRQFESRQKRFQFFRLANRLVRRACPDRLPSDPATPFPAERTVRALRRVDWGLCGLLPLSCAIPAMSAATGCWCRHLV